MHETLKSERLIWGGEIKKHKCEMEKIRSYSPGHVIFR